MTPRKAKRSFRKADGFDPVDLLKFARGHLSSAEILFGTNYHCFDSAAYLAHVAVELLLKAALLHETKSFPAEHRLPQLRLALKRLGIRFTLSRSAQKGFSLLNSYQDARYPDPRAPVEVGDEDLPHIQRLWNEMLAQIQATLRDAFATSDQLSKGSRVLMYKPKRHATAT